MQGLKNHCILLPKVYKPTIELTRGGRQAGRQAADVEGKSNLEQEGGDRKRGGKGEVNPTNWVDTGVPHQPLPRNVHQVAMFVMKCYLSSHK